MSREDRGLLAEEARGVTKTRGLPIPFSSRRMKAEWLKKVAGEVGVPVPAAATDLRLMLEGKLTEMGKQPTNVQAQREEGEEEGNPILSLLDEEGIFLQVELEPELEREESPDHVAHTVDGLDTKEDGGTLGDTSRAESEPGDEPLVNEVDTQTMMTGAMMRLRPDQTWLQSDQK